MEHDKELNSLITQAFLEVESDLSLRNNSLVDGTSSPKISKKVRFEEMEVRLDQNFMARMPEKLIRHSKELVLRKCASHSAHDQVCNTRIFRKYDLCF